jgi:hypothetical protein
MKAKSLLLALLALGLAGCGSATHEQSAPVPQATHATRALPRPTVKFTGPAIVKSGSTYKATVKLGHFHIAANMVGKAPVPGMGHLHFMLDGGKYDTPHYAGANGAIGKKLGVMGAYSPAVAPDITYSHLPPGRYTLVCMLANNNHTPTGVQAKQTIIVR